uniref:Uncharacterized protein n=1 Tax=Panagrolaimus sp. JU765 TaxID=591449 RepID=A0AC34QHK8_9BILA
MSPLIFVIRFSFGVDYARIVRLLAAILFIASFVSGFQVKAEDYSEEKRIPNPGDFLPKRISFSEWVNSTSKSSNARFFDHSSLAEGEVLLFRTKKNKNRAIPVMRSSPSGVASKFSDALTFKEWLRRTSPGEKAIRITVRSTDVVRPVLQHLYAARQDFTTPVIVHANTFSSKQSSEKPVDPIIFIENVQKLLPESTVSLGWTPSSDYAAVNRLDWSKTFKLMSNPSVERSCFCQNGGCNT